MIALKKCVRQTVTVKLILLVESHGLIVELEFFMYCWLHTVCISNAGVHSAFFYIHVRVHCTVQW